MPCLESRGMYFGAYGLAIFLVALAVVVRLIFQPLLRDRYPFLFFFVAVVLAANYGGYGPSLVALALSWFVADSLFLISPGNPQLFHSRFQIALAFFTVGLVVTVLGGGLRKARERVWASMPNCVRRLNRSRRSGNGCRSPWPASRMPSSPPILRVG